MDLIVADDPPLAAQSSDASRAYAATALRDPSRRAELRMLLDVIDGLGVRHDGHPGDPPAGPGR